MIRRSPVEPVIAVRAVLLSRECWDSAGGDEELEELEEELRFKVNNDDVIALRHARVKSIPARGIIICSLSAYPNTNTDPDRNGNGHYHHDQYDKPPFPPPPRSTRAVCAIDRYIIPFLVRAIEDCFGRVVLVVYFWICTLRYLLAIQDH